MTTIDPAAEGEGGPAVDRMDDVESDVLAAAAAAVDPLGETVDLTPLDHSRRLLFVHAHPDDEAIQTGATMARYVAESALVTLVTCTLGERGEVIPPELAHLTAEAADDGGLALAQHRHGELATAMEALGVTDSRLLGGVGRWHDSGMAGSTVNDHADTFWRADPEATVGALVDVLRQVRPQVVVTYDERGGYGHPDHIQARRVTAAAIEAAAAVGEEAEAWQVQKLYEVVLPLSSVRDSARQLRELGAAAPFEAADPEQLDVGVPDELVTTEIDGRSQLDAKVAALRAHRTQVSVSDGFFALSNGFGQRIDAVERFRLVFGPPVSGGLETDLFDGVR